MKPRPHSTTSEDLSQPTVQLRVGEQYQASGSASELSYPTMEFQVPEVDLPHIPGYVIFSVIGRGGMGIVYEGLHSKLNRHVALKTLRADSLCDPSFRMRFQAEAEAIAKLQHPNIIQVFEVGNVDAKAARRHQPPYIALELVDGGSLSKYVHQPQQPRFAAEMVQKLARAAHAAHRLGIVHRDLKPSNVLLTKELEPKIADFGIAKQVDAVNTGHESPTQQGMVMGTTEYMAPEQLRGYETTPSIDIYALGVILYELLAGRVPFQGENAPDTVRLIMNEEPTSLRTFQPNLPRDLETICLTCLQKARDKRYATAEALADDLRRWLDGQVIMARPCSVFEKTARWVKRNRAVAFFSMTAFMLFVLGLSGILWQWRQANLNAIEAKDNATKLQQALVEANIAVEEADQERYRASLLAASAALRSHDVGVARNALENVPSKHRDWIWNVLYSQLDRSLEIIPSGEVKREFVNFSHNNHWVIYQTIPDSIVCYNLLTRETFGPHIVSPESTRFLISNDGTLAAYASSDHDVILIEPKTNQIQQVLRGHEHMVDQIYFSADEKRVIATGHDRTVVIWNIENGDIITRFVAPPSADLPMMVSPDEQFVAFRMYPNKDKNDYHGLIYELATGQLKLKLESDSNQLQRVDITPDGSKAIAVERYPSNRVRLWDMKTGKLLMEAKGHQNMVLDGKFNQSGTRYFTSSMDRTICVWDTSTNVPIGNSKPIFQLDGHNGWIQNICINHDGSRLISSSTDTTLRYWNCETGKLIGVLHGHNGGVYTSRIIEGSESIVSWAEDGSIRLWDIAEVERDNAITGHKTFVYSAKFHPNNSEIVSASWDGSVRRWNSTNSRQLQCVQFGEKVFVSSASYSPDGKRIACFCRDNSIRILDVETGDVLHQLNTFTDHWCDSKVIFNSAGDTLAYGCPDGTVRMWKLGTKPTDLMILGTKNWDAIRDVAFSPDGKLLIAGHADQLGLFSVWDVESRQLIHSIRTQQRGIFTVVWSPDGKILASGSADGSLKLWNTTNWQQVGKTMHNTAECFCVAFSPDQSIIAAACSDSLVRIWNFNSQIEVAAFSGHREYVHSVDFSSDGTRLVSASGDGTIRIWDSVPKAKR